MKLQYSVRGCIKDDEAHGGVSDKEEEERRRGVWILSTPRR
jgi:hypothetical protein